MIKWFNRYNFPYSNFHDLNLDWLIKEMKRLIDEWEILKAEWEQMKIEWVEFQAEMQRLWEEYKALMEAAWEAYKANLNEEWADYKDEMNAAWLAYQNDLNAQWTAYQNTLNNAWQAYQNAMNEWKDGVDQDIQDKFDEIDAKCAECQAAVQAAIDTLNNLLTTVQQQVEDYLANLPYETIIHDAAMEWLDEHGITVEDLFLTPEEFGAVGDGTTDDRDAFSRLFAAAASEKKPIELKADTQYMLNNWLNIPANTVINGNNATILFPSDGSNHYLGVTSFTVIRDLRVLGRGIQNNGGCNNLYLENVYAQQLSLGMSATSGDGIVLNNVEVLDACAIGSAGSEGSASNFYISGLRLNNANASIAGNGTIEGISTNCFLQPVTLQVFAREGDVSISNNNNISITKVVISTGAVKIANTTSL